MGGWNVRGGTHTLCSLFVEGVGRDLGGCVACVEEEDDPPSEIFERLGFGTRFGEGCLGISSSSLFSHLDRFREGVKDPARDGSIGIVRRWVSEQARADHTLLRRFKFLT